MVLIDLLEKLVIPRSVSDLARMTGYSEESVRQMLAVLSRKGYAMDVGCTSACGVCSLKNLCPSVGKGGEIWIITPKGREYLRKQRVTT